MIQHLVFCIIVIILIRYLKDFVEFVREVRYRYKLTNGMAGPENFPLLGCLHKAPLDSNLILDWLVEESYKAINKGESVMIAWLGPFKSIVTPLSSDAVRVITGSTIEIHKGVDYAFFEDWLGPALLLGSGERWFKTRKLLTPAFHFAKIEEYSHTMDFHARTMIELINQQDTKNEVNLYYYIKLCSLDIIADATMGVRLNAQEDSSQPYVKAVEKFSYLGYIYSQRPYYAFFGNFLWRILGYHKQTQETLKILKSFTRKVVHERVKVDSELREHQTDGVEKKKLNFLDTMLEMHAEGQMTIQELREETDTFMFAGHDTTAITVSWAIWALATHPDVQSRLYEEIVANFGESDAEFSSSKLKDLKYLDMVLKEILRIRPAVPVVQKQLQNDVEIGGWTIPKNMTINLFPYILHHNPKVFPNPKVFDPERFAEGKEYPANMYIPFSAGSRNCIGQKFAQRNAKIMITHLVFNFEFSTDLKFEDNKPRAEVVTKPDLGVPVRIRYRHK